MNPGIERLLTLEEAAAVLGTKPRFTRRLVAERRIRFTHVGRHVRIPESALREFIKAGTVEPVTVDQQRQGRLMANAKGRRRRFGASANCPLASGRHATETQTA